MKVLLKKFNLLALFAFATLFLASCNGTTSIYGIEHRSNSKHHKKSYPKYDVRYGDRYDKHRGLPPGQHKKVHGDRSARAYAPGQNKSKSKKHYKKGNNNHHRSKSGHKR